MCNRQQWLRVCHPVENISLYGWPELRYGKLQKILYSKKKEKKNSQIGKERERCRGKEVKEQISGFHTSTSNSNVQLSWWMSAIFTSIPSGHRSIEFSFLSSVIRFLLLSFFRLLKFTDKYPILTHTFTPTLSYETWNFWGEIESLIFRYRCCYCRCCYCCCYFWIAENMADRKRKWKLRQPRLVVSQLFDP